MVRSIRNIGKFVWLGLMSGALALPLAAEEITVTVPPDDPPAQTAPQPAASPSLPSFAASDSAQKPVADSSDPTAHSTDDATSAPPAAPVKHKAKQKKAAAVTPAGDAATPAPEAAASAAPADGAVKPATKTKTAKASPCFNIDENACGANSACIWVAAGTNDAGKATKARCRSLAILKREAAKAEKAGGSGKSEVLPWAGGASTASTTTATAETPKPAKKTKTASAKKASKPKSEPAAAPAPAATDSSAPGGDPQGSSGAD